MSFPYQEVKYFCPFYRDEEFFIKPKYYTNSPSITVLGILSDMFRRQLLDGEEGKLKTEQYWRKIIEVDRRVSVLLIFSDKIYREYRQLQKPSKNANQNSTKHSFVTISRAETVVPIGLLHHFWPSNLNLHCDEDDRLKGARLKIRIERQHIHPRSIVVPYQPTIIYEDQNIIAVNKPFGIPSMGEINDLASNEWNSILTWCRQKASDEKQQKSKQKQRNGNYCDLMNRLDLDVSGLVLLGKSGAYRKKRGFAKENKADQTKTIKVYLGIIPKVHGAVRIMTPRLGFDKRRSKAIIKQNDDDPNKSALCKTSVYPLLDLDDGCHSLVAIQLEESGQRHQIRFHLSLVGAAIANESLYSTQDDGSNHVRRTGVGSSSHRPTNSVSNNSSSSSNKKVNNPRVRVESIEQDDCHLFLQNYVYTNGVTGFRQCNQNIKKETYQGGLIQRTLYPCHEKHFSDQIKGSFEFCSHCGKCVALQAATRIDDDAKLESIEKEATILVHGIYLHSWRYFHPTKEHRILEAEIPGDYQQGENQNYWWPVQVVKEERAKVNDWK
jgi:23S rRNA-/tRNA-specific pseudouridylate synthase